jgi:hypothetical protein
MQYYIILFRELHHIGRSRVVFRVSFDIVQNMCDIGLCYYFVSNYYNISCMTISNN